MRVMNSLQIDDFSGRQDRGGSVHDGAERGELGACSSAWFDALVDARGNRGADDG